MRIVFPRPATTHQMLAAPTLAHRVALEAAQGVVAVWCRIADTDVQVARAAIRAFCDGRCDTVDSVALAIRRGVWACWDDRRDAHPESIGRSSLGDGCPEGCIDVCRAAALITCSVAGMVEPTDDHAAIMEVWYRDLCASAQRAVSVDIGPLDLRRPRHALADLIENAPRWPGDPTPFRRSLDEIARSAIQCNVVLGSFKEGR